MPSSCKAQQPQFKYYLFAIVIDASGNYLAVSDAKNDIDSLMLAKKFQSASQIFSALGALGLEYVGQINSTSFLDAAMKGRYKGEYTLWKKRID